MRRGFRVLAGNDYPQCLELLQYQLPNVPVLEAESPPGGGDGVLEVMQKRLEAQRVPDFELTTEQRRSASDRIARYTISHLFPWASSRPNTWPIVSTDWRRRAGR